MKKLLLSFVALIGLSSLAFAESVTFDFTQNDYGLDRWDNDKGTGGYLEDGQTIESGDVTITFHGGWRLWTDGIREYYKNGASFTVTADGESVTGVTLDVVSGATFKVEGYNNGANITSWTGSEASVTFVTTATANKAVKTITVYYGEGTPDIPDTPETPAAPEGVITVTEALAIIASNNIPTDAVQVKGIISTIEEVSPNYGNATFDIVDKAGDTNALKIFRTKWFDGQNFTSENQIGVGAEVVVEGVLQNYNGTPEITTGKIISYNGETSSETPETPDDPKDPDTPSESTALNVNDAEDIVGTFNEEKLKDDGSVQQAANYQPLQSFMLGGYTFEFSTTSTTASQMPAYYYATSTNANQQKTVRIYSGTTMKITAPEGVNMTKVEFTGSNLGNNAAFTVDKGSWTTQNNAVWTGSANSFSVTANATWRMSELVVYTGEGGETPENPDETTVIFSETFGTSLGDFTIEDKVIPEELTYVWSFAANYGAKASAFYNSTNYATESWLISPVIDLSTFTDLTLSFDHATNYFEDATTATGVYVREENGEWTALTATYPETQSWTFVNSGLIDIDKYQGKKIQLGFKYTSTDTKAGTWEIKNVLVKGEGEGEVDVPVQPATEQYAKVTEIVAGKSYVFAADGKLCSAVAPSLTYGRWTLVDATFTDNEVASAPANAVLITEGDDGYLLQDADGRYIAMDSGHTTTFQIFTEINEGCYWLIDFEETGEVVISNNLTGAVVCQSVGANGTFYTNVAPAILTAESVYNLPTIYMKKAESGIANIISSDENAPVEYFNLQGVRVANPENGLYIRRQGNTVTKVIVK
ncbi:MAG: choice-of-anchor J domain-containing protein [Muribaculaceae bacterium]|nr:choice-of-anchor J domain-containing protein [Muribaculaceae bacterium]